VPLEPLLLVPLELLLLMPLELLRMVSLELLEPLVLAPLLTLEQFFLTIQVKNYLSLYHTVNIFKIGSLALQSWETLSQNSLIQIENVEPLCAVEVFRKTKMPFPNSEMQKDASNLFSKFVKDSHISWRVATTFVTAKKTKLIATI
jgi:hypothetical protein